MSGNYEKLMANLTASAAAIEGAKFSFSPMLSLNFNLGSLPISFDQLASMNLGLNLDSAGFGGLSVMANLSGLGNEMLNGAVAQLTGVSTEFINNAINGVSSELTSAATDILGGQENIQASLTQLGAIADLPTFMEEINTIASTQGISDLTPEVVAQAVQATQTAFANMPAEALYSGITTIQSQLGASLGEVGTALTGGGTLGIEKVPAQIFAGLGVNASDLAAQVGNNLMLGASADITAAISGLNSEQLQDLTSGIYGIENIAAKLEKFDFLNASLGLSFEGFQIGISL